MPGLVDFVRLVSLDVARGLVQQGLGLGFAAVGSGGVGKTRFTVTGSPSPLAIIDASNTSPIMLTCAQPHGVPLTRATGYPNELHAVVQGVRGNTAANAVDATPAPAVSRTIGMNRGVQLVPISATQFEMYAQSYTTGLLEPLAGNGAYTGGGTIRPGLTAGQVLFGREHCKFENIAAGAPPFMGVVVIGNKFADGARRVAHGAIGLTAERLDQLKYRAIGIDRLVMELHVWGAAHPRDPAMDFEIAQRLYQQWFQSLHLLGVGTFVPEDGEFVDQREKGTQLLKDGHYHVMRFGVETPVLEFAMEFVPTPITPNPTTYMQLQDGGPPEEGCSG